MDEAGRSAQGESVESYGQFNEVLDNGVEIPPDKNIEQLLQRLNEPVYDHKYGEILGVDGEVITEKLNVRSTGHSYDLQFGFIEEGTEQWASVQRYIDTDTHIMPYPLQTPNAWREVTTLNLSGPEGRTNISIFDIMPDKYHIFFTDSKEQIQGSLASETRSIYLAGGDFAAPIRLLTLLHEIGHMWDLENIKSGEVKQISEGSHADLAERFRKERAASAFELKIVRSVTAPGDQLRQDALDYVKYHSLQSYREGFKKEVAERESNAALGREMAKDIVLMTDDEEIEQAQWDEFFKWQMTEEFQQWRSQDEYKNLEDWEEFPSWKKWREHNGTAWWTEGGNTPPPDEPKDGGDTKE